jgi:hypothetical protein
MKCALNNQTPLAAQLLPHRDLAGRPHVLVIAKATWSLRTGRLAPAEQQLGLREQPQQIRLGELDLDDAQRQALGERQDDEVVWLDHELLPPKPAFDVIVAGYVTAPPQFEAAQLDAGQLDAGIRIGKQTTVLRARVPRVWERGALGYTIKPLAKAVRRVPLTYAVADWSGGFALTATPNAPQGLPWLEDLMSPSQRTRHAPQAVGFGHWPQNAAHRQPHGGTYGDAWQDQRAPDLPLDFNPRFHNSAHPELQLPQAPAPGTTIGLAHLAASPTLNTQMPDLQLAVQATTAAGAMQSVLRMPSDTLVIEPDDLRMSQIWRVLLPTPSGSDALRSLRLFKV